MPALPVPARLSNTRWDLFHNRNFRLLWTSQMISQVGEGLTKIALIWFVYQLTGSALKMTMIGLLQTIPPLILCPMLGVYLDRWPKKPVLVLIDIIRAFLIALIPILYALDALSLEVLYVLVFFTAIFSTVFGPGLAASLPLLVKPSELMSANSLIHSTVNIGMLIGPAVGGMLIAWLGTQNVLYVNTVTFLLSALFILPIHNARFSAVPQRAEEPGTMGQDLLAGLGYVLRETPLLRFLLVMTVFFTLGASAFIYVLPLFVNDHLNADPQWLGWLWSSMGIGMVMTSLSLSFLKNVSQRARLMLIACFMILGGSALHLLSQTHSIIWGFLLVCVIGASSAAFNPITWSLIQETTPHHLMGRVFTLIGTASMAAASGGIVAFGVTGDTLGTMAGIAMIGFIFLGTGVMALAFQRRLLLPDQRARTDPKANSDSDPQASMMWRSARSAGAVPSAVGKSESSRLASLRPSPPWSLENIPADRITCSLARPPP